MSASIVVAADHFLRGIWWPSSVFGVLTPDSWRWLEHAAWVVFEDVFLLLAIDQSVREMHVIADRQARMEATEISLRLSETELMVAKGEAERASEAKSTFLANMSHEIRTPMNAILGFGDLLADKEIEESDRQQFIHRIRANGDQLLRLIDDVLDLSKIEAGTVPLEKLRFSLTDAVSEVMRLFGPLAERKQLKLNVVFTTPVPEKICSDPIRLKQILTNLVGNAIKFTDAGSVDMRLRFTRSELPGTEDSVGFEIADTGIGISSDHQRDLFQPFKQADHSISRRFGGTGLGLALSRRLANALGGDLRLTSSVPGHGSCFELTVQIGMATPSVFVGSLGDFTAPEKNHVRSGPRVPRLTGVRILLVEDSADNEALVRHFLEMEEAVVSVARDGFEAISRAHSVAPDLILMDVQMPRLDGLSATRHLRQNGFTKPILALTAHALKDEVDKSFAAGCNAHLNKPVHRAALVEAICTHLPTRAENQYAQI